MLKNLKKKFAKVALAALALQLVFAGLGFGAGKALALESLQLKTDLDSQVITAGQEVGFTVSLSNTNGNDYDAVLSTFKVYGTKVADIESFKYLETKDGNWYDVPMAQLGLDVVGYFGDPSKGFPVVDGYQATSSFKILFKTPGVYNSVIEADDIKNNLVLATLPVNGVSVSEDIDMSTDLAARVKPATDILFKATLDNSYGLDHTATATITIKDALVADIAKLQNSGKDIALTQVDTDVVAVFASESISAGSKYTFDMLVNFVTEKDYHYAITLTDDITNELLSTFTGSVEADGTGPLVTMTSKPVIVNDLKKAVEVTFSANESMALVGPSIQFVQGLVIKSIVPEVQTDPTKLVTIIPADTFAEGNVAIKVSGKFVDLLDNSTDFAGEIKVDNVAPSAVTGVTTLVNADGTVTISWVNPPAGTYSSLRIVRVGGFTLALDPSVTSYTDSTTVKGETYQYSIVVSDEAGNETVLPYVSVSVPAEKVAAAVSDTVAPAPTTSNEEVKAEVAPTDTKVDSQTGFPTWGIILLVVLALVGGYLIWNQKPTEEVVPVVTPKTKSKAKKK